MQRSPAERLPATNDDDARALRALIDSALIEPGLACAPSPDVIREDVQIVTHDGVRLAARWCTRRDSRPGSAVLFLHGGGLIAGSMKAYDLYVAQHVQWTGVPILAVDYRLAPEVRQDVPSGDGFAAFLWLQKNAATRGVDPERIAVMGDSAGGGLAASVAIRARDTRLPVAAQILIFPMLDDRTGPPSPELEPHLAWSYRDNVTGWRALLADRFRTATVSPYAVPARVANLHGLAPAYIEVGSLDLFCDESIGYARRLLRAGVETELHVHPGAAHGYDSVTADAAFVARWTSDRVRVLTNV